MSVTIYHSLLRRILKHKLDLRLILYIQGMAPRTSKLKLLRSLKGSIQVLF